MICTSEKVNYVERLSVPTGLVGEKRACAECRIRKGYVEGWRCRLRLGQERIKCGLEAEKVCKGNIHHWGRSARAAIR
jgi:hypothetical protein